VLQVSPESIRPLPQGLGQGPISAGQLEHVSPGSGRPLPHGGGQAPTSAGQLSQVSPNSTRPLPQLATRAETVSEPVGPNPVQVSVKEVSLVRPPTACDPLGVDLPPPDQPPEAVQAFWLEFCTFQLRLAVPLAGKYT
jgi:hypothetical protein